MSALAVELWRAPTPIPRPVLTAAGLYDTYFHLVAVVTDTGGVAGWGYAGLPSAGDLDASARFAAALIDADPPTLASLLRAERAAYDTASRAATCALSLAAWDVAGRRLDVACADLWGRAGSATSLACYGSGFFLDASIDGLIDEAQRYRSQGYRYVKMRVGLDVRDDIARFRAVASVFPEPGAIAVDAFHSWSASDVRAFVGAVGPDLLWIEDATPYAELAAAQPVAAPMASGESLETADDLVALQRDGRLDYSLPDVMRLGGPRNWLNAARELIVVGARVGSHVFTPHSLHLLACVDNPLPVEVFDWSDPLFVSPPAPDKSGLLTIGGPGFGIELNRAMLERHGERVR